MEQLDLYRLLRENAYPGRGIVLGLAPGGTKAAIAYFIMGRSANSRNRVFAEEPDGIRTQAADPARMEDPSLIIYHPVRQMGRGLIVTNGDQTDTILEFLKQGLPMEQAQRQLQAVHPESRRRDRQTLPAADLRVSRPAGDRPLPPHLRRRRRSPALLCRRAGAGGRGRGH